MKRVLAKLRDSLLRVLDRFIDKITASSHNVSKGCGRRSEKLRATLGHPTSAAVPHSMQRIPLLLTPAAVLVLLTSSACSPMRFSQYSGPNRSNTVSEEAVAETSFRLPVYRSWPDKPYDILGTLRFENPNQNWDDGIINDAVAAAKKRKADAIIIRVGGEFGVGGNIGFAEDRTVWQSTQTTAVAIKWKPREQIEAEMARRHAFKTKFASSHPDLTRNGAVVDAAIDYLIARGTSLDSPTASSALQQILSELQGPRDGELGGKWLYRCHLNQSRLTSSWSTAAMGVASVNVKGDVLTIVSVDQGNEVSFSGSYDKGRVSGQMGLGALSIDCSGVAAAEKISLSGQGRTADGVCQASLVFQR